MLVFRTKRRSVLRDLMLLVVVFRPTRLIIKAHMGWLRNTTVVHRTIRRSHTRRRKQAEEQERQKALKRQQRKNRKIVDASAAVRMQHFMQPRTTVIEKVNKRTRKLKEVKERRRRARRKRKQSEHNDESIT